MSVLGHSDNLRVYYAKWFSTTVSVSLTLFSFSSFVTKHPVPDTIAVPICNASGGLNPIGGPQIRSSLGATIIDTPQRKIGEGSEQESIVVNHLLLVQLFWPDQDLHERRVDVTALTPPFSTSSKSLSVRPEKTGFSR